MPSLQVSPYAPLVYNPTSRSQLSSELSPMPWDVKTSKGSDNGRAVTGPQMEMDLQTGALPHNNPYRFTTRNRRWVDFRKMRTVRRDPTIALAREVAVAPIIGSSWTLKVIDNDVVTPEMRYYFERYLMPLRNKFLRTALFGEIDFGWRCYEKILNSVKDKKLGAIVIAERLKPLLNDTTYVKYNDDGDFDGMFHQDPTTNRWVWIDRAYSIFANFDDDGLGYYNDPRLLRAEGAYDEWNRIAEVSRRFNEKFAGSVWVIHYPEGISTWRGKRVDNREIATEIAFAIRASGYLVLPSKLLADAKGEMEELGQSEWRIEQIESSSKQGDFVSAMDYQDKLKIRALGILERAVVEGNYGTKAESESHVNVMLLNMQLKHEDLTELFNREVADHLSILNFGEAGLMEFQAQPLTDERYELFQSILTAMVSNPETSAEIFDQLDTKELFNHLRVPILPETSNKMGELFKLLTGGTASSQMQDAKDSYDRGEQDDVLNDAPEVASMSMFQNSAYSDDIIAELRNRQGRV